MTHDDRSLVDRAKGALGMGHDHEHEHEHEHEGGIDTERPIDEASPHRTESIGGVSGAPEAAGWAGPSGGMGASGAMGGAGAGGPIGATVQPSRATTQPAERIPARSRPSTRWDMRWTPSSSRSPRAVRAPGQCLRSIPRSSTTSTTSRGASSGFSPTSRR